MQQSSNVISRQKKKNILPKDVYFSGSQNHWFQKVHNETETGALFTRPDPEHIPYGQQELSASFISLLTLMTAICFKDLVESMALCLDDLIFISFT